MIGEKNVLAFDDYHPQDNKDLNLTVEFGLNYTSTLSNQLSGLSLG